MLELAADAIRMLALCTYESDIEGDELPADGLTLVGILGIRDEVRPEAIEAIAEVQDAGVQIVMITGDRRETAVAIAKDARPAAASERVGLDLGRACGNERRTGETGAA